VQGGGCGGGERISRRDGGLREFSKRRILSEKGVPLAAKLEQARKVRSPGCNVHRKMPGKR